MWHDKLNPSSQVWFHNAVYYNFHQLKSIFHILETLFTITRTRPHHYPSSPPHLKLKKNRKKLYLLWSRKEGAPYLSFVHQVHWHTKKKKNTFAITIEESAPSERILPFLRSTPKSPFGLNALLDFSPPPPPGSPHWPRLRSRVVESEGICI